MDNHQKQEEVKSHDYIKESSEEKQAGQFFSDDSSDSSSLLHSDSRIYSKRDLDRKQQIQWQLEMKNFQKEANKINQDEGQPLFQDFREELDELVELDDLVLGYFSDGAIKNSKQKKKKQMYPHLLSSFPLD